MTLHFLAERSPGDASCRDLAGLASHNPFNTAAYAAVRSAAGAEPWLLAVCRDKQLIAGCYGFLQRGRLTSRFEVHSLPKLEQATPFWAGLVKLCREQRVAELKINSFGSIDTQIPKLDRELGRRARREYCLDLTAPSLWQALSSNHKRNIKRGKKAGLTLVQCGEAEAAEAHAQAIGQSMRRREARGEHVSTAAEASPFLALMAQGAGQLFQAKVEGRVMSSLLVLRAEKGAYYHSAGSVPEGMALGAAHFLVSGVAELLRDEGLEVFNLGGADASEEGLARFKAGFGAHPIDLEAARFAVCSPMQRVIFAAMHAVGSRL